jgi:hypothetical protein
MRVRSQRGQAAVETALVIPLLMLALFGAYQIGRLLYIYHILQKAMRGGAQHVIRLQGVNFCDSADPALFDAKNFIVYGNLQGAGEPIVAGLTTEMIQFFPERGDPASTLVADCPCSGDGHCDVLSGGRPPDYVTVQLPSGFPVDLTFPLIRLGTITLRVSVRQPFLGA